MVFWMYFQIGILQLNDDTVLPVDSGQFQVVLSGKTSWRIEQVVTDHRKLRLETHSNFSMLNNCPGIFDQFPSVLKKRKKVLSVLSVPKVAIIKAMWICTKWFAVFSVFLKTGISWFKISLRNSYK